MAKTGNIELVIRLPSDLHAATKAHAERNERTIAGTVRMALREYLKIPLADTQDES